MKLEKQYFHWCETLGYYQLKRNEMELVGIFNNINPNCYVKKYGKLVFYPMKIPIYIEKSLIHWDCEVIQAQLERENSYIVGFFGNPNVFCILSFGRKANIKILCKLKSF